MVNAEGEQIHLRLREDHHVNDDPNCRHPHSWERITPVSVRQTSPFLGHDTEFVPSIDMACWGIGLGTSPESFSCWITGFFFSSRAADPPRKSGRHDPPIDSMRVWIPQHATAFASRMGRRPSSFHGSLQRLRVGIRDQVRSRA